LCLRSISRSCLKMATAATLEALDFYAKTYQRYLEPMVVHYNPKRQRLEPIPWRNHLLFTFHILFVNGVVVLGSSFIVLMKYIILPQPLVVENRLPILNIFVSILIVILTVFCLLLYTFAHTCKYDVCYLWNNMVTIELLHNASKLEMLKESMSTPNTEGPLKRLLPNSFFFRASKIC
jgi:hypothetical protein